MKQLKNNIKIIPLFESAFNNNINLLDKNKSPLEILQNNKKSNNSTGLHKILRNKTLSLKTYNKNLKKYILKWNYKNLLNNIQNNNNIIQIKNNKYNINNNNKYNINKNNNNITIHKSNKININNLNINKFKYNIDSKIKNNITLPINLIGKNPIKQTINKYIKLITKFNTEIIKFKTNNYNFNYYNNKFIKNIYSLLEYTFNSMACLISKPFFSFTSDKIIIHLFFFLVSKINRKRNKFKFRNKFFNKTKINNNKYNFLNFNKKKRNFITKTFLIKNKIKLQRLCEILSKIFNKPIELELTRLHYPFYDPNIFVNALGLIINKIKLRFILKRLFKVAIIKNPTRIINRKRFSLIPCYLSGIKLKIAGRLMTQRVVPRKTVKIIQKGSLARRKAIFVENARFTNKNRRGSFSITISTGYFM